jgi:HEAT repeat protein
MSALDALRDKDPAIKLQACEALRWINDPRASQPLRQAINLEKEEAIQRQMKSTLNYLEKEHSTH